MLALRTETILKAIVGQYIIKATPVPSQSIINDYDLGVSSATIRNEMAYLEQEGYIIRPHHSAGSVPSDLGYRRYVETLGDVKLPLVEQRLISHLFHQVEKELDEWLSLASALVAQMVQNVAVVSMPKLEACQFKHLELVSLQDSTILIILVLNGARVREQIITFDQALTQPELTATANKLRESYAGSTGDQISAKTGELSTFEKQVTECIVKAMENEDEKQYEEHYLNGLHFMFNHPEFINNRPMMLTLVDLIEQRHLLRSIMPSELTGDKVQVIIGKENKSEVIHDYSVVIGRYGLSQGAVGAIGVIGPTRMPYARTIATVEYLSSVLSVLVARLYGRESPASNTENIDKAKEN